MSFLLKIKENRVSNLNMLIIIGCLNGGAQVRPLGDKTIRELTLDLEKIYSGLTTQKPEQNKTVKELYDAWLGGIDSDKSLNLLHTEYHAVEKLNTALNIKW